MEMCKRRLLFQTQYSLSSVLFCANGRGFPWGTINSVRVEIPLTHVKTNATISPPPAIHQKILLGGSREAVMYSIFSWAVLNSPPSGRRDHSIEEHMLYWQHMALWKTVAAVFPCPLLPLLLWHLPYLRDPAWQPVPTTLFLHKPGKILPFSSAARWTGAEVT